MTVDIRHGLDPEPIALPRRFALLKERLTAGNHASLASSWTQLLAEIQKEVDLVSCAGSDIIPTIDFADITSSKSVDGFQTQFRRRGVAVIRNVVPKDTALDWGKSLRAYIDTNQNSVTCSAPNTEQIHEAYWSPAQVQARAHPNVLTAQKFAMGLWKSKGVDDKLSTNFPLSYADRMWVRPQGVRNDRACALAYVDGGSVERWEEDGYGRAKTYDKIFQGDWQNYDPWDVSNQSVYLTLFFFSFSSISPLPLTPGSLKDQ